MTTETPNQHDQFVIFKGATYQLCPLTLPLTLMIISHNIIIITDYFKDRSKFVPCLMMGIALSDILNAQGQLLISVMSVLVYNDVLHRDVLYKSLYYYMATGLPGSSCSRLFNIALSLTLTVHLVDPFRRLNTWRLKFMVAIVAIIITILHLADAVSVCVAEYKFHIKKEVQQFYVKLLAVFGMPGSLTTALIVCNPLDGKLEHSHCYDKQFAWSTINVIPAIALTLNFILPPLLVLICMVIQVVCLRRQARSQTSSLARSSHHASITIVTVSFLYCVTHFAFIVFGIIWANLIGFKNQDQSKLPSTEHLGNAIGILQFVLPLIYAVLYPVILIVRKPELRESGISTFTGELSYVAD